VAAIIKEANTAKMISHLFLRMFIDTSQSLSGKSGMNARVINATMQALLRARSILQIKG